MIKLLVKFGEESREVEFDVPEISIGRATDNVLPLADKKSSRKHARIEKVGDEYRVNDLGSGNGTRVNGRDVNTHVLAKGDEIGIGLTTIYVLTLDTPARPATAHPPVAVAAPAPVAPAAAPATSRSQPERPAESAEEARRKITRRGVAKSTSGGWVGTAASILVLAGIAAGGWYLYDKHERESSAKAEVRRVEEAKSTEKYREAEQEYAKFSKFAAADPVEDSTIALATEKMEKFGALYPAFDALVSQLKQRRAEQIGRDDLASVDGRIQTALRERRFGDALQALKDLKASVDPAASGTLVAKVCDSINQEFKSIDDYGRKLADDGKFTPAADHYRMQAPRFKGTEHYKYLLYKPETLELRKKAEADSSLARTSRPAETDTALAKADVAPPAKETPKEPARPAPEPATPKPEPAMPKPEPAMPKESMPKESMPKESMPKPATPKETPKPPPPAPKAPAMSKEEDKKEDIGGNIKGFRKPDVLCDCKKILKGVYCVKCDRMLAPEDMRNGVCKRCEEKPKKIDLCVKRYYMVDGQPDKRSEKPILFEGKLYDFPYEDKARIVYYCEGCQETGDSQGEVKHKPDCQSKNVIKVCSKSGTPPHGGEKK